jgi:hypothetical protein
LELVFSSGEYLPCLQGADWVNLGYHDNSPHAFQCLCAAFSYLEWGKVNVWRSLWIWIYLSVATHDNLFASKHHIGCALQSKWEIQLWITQKK